MTRKVDWHSRGRDAFTEGMPCFFDNARVNGPDRQAWYDGWKHQRNLNAKPANEDDRLEAIAALQQIRDSLNS